MFPYFIVMSFGKQGTAFWFYVFFQMIATIFVTIWDFYMDWGLFRSTKQNTRFLRNQITFEPEFYYKCMFINLIFRHFWIIPLLLPPNHTDVSQMSFFQPIVLLSMVIEMLRRSIWAVIRVENESINNFEEYRSINTIPPIKEDSVNE